MRIIYILNATDMYGGATKAVMNLLEGEVAKSIQPLFILPSDTGIAHTLRQKGIPYEVLTYRMSVYPPLRCAKDILLFIPRLVGRIFVNWTAAKQLYSIAKEFKADIIHTNTSVNNIGYVVSRRLNIPHVWHIREYADLDFNLHYIPSKACFLKKLKEDQSYTICITKDIQKYNNLHNWPSSRVIYDGVLSKNQSALIVPKQPYFLFAGRLEQGKGIEDLLEAYAIYVKQTDHPVPLWIAGDTQDADYKKKLERMVSSIDGTSSIAFLGMREDILSLMQHTMALIVPSKAEGFGFITAEGMFSGALVIGRNTGGTKEQLDNGLTISGQEIGLRYNTQNELIAHLLQVTKDGIDPYIPMIKRGQTIVQRLYSIESHQQTVLEFYNHIISKR